MKLSQLQNRIDEIVKKAGLGGDLVSVLRGAGLVMIIQIAAAGLNYVSQVILARLMGTFEFGIYVFAWSWALPLATAAAIGLAAAADRFVPQYKIKDAWGLLLGLIRRSMWIVFGAGTFIAGLGLIVLVVFNTWLADYYVIPTQIAISCVPFLTLVVLLSGVSRGFGWVALAFVPQMLLIPIALILSVFLHYWLIGTPSATAVLVWMLCACGLIALGHSYRFRHTMPKEIHAAEPIYETRTWLRVAIPLFLADGIFLVLWNVDTLMLGSMMKPQDVSIYHAAVKTAGLVLLVFNAVRSFAAPKFAALYVEKSRAHQQEFARSIAKWMFWPTALVVLVVIVAGKLVLSFFGSEFVAGYPVIIVLCSAYLVRTVAGPLSALLAVSGNQDDILIVNIGAGIGNVVLNAILIPLFGIMGAAFATVFAMLGYQTALYILVRHRLGIDAFFLSRSQGDD